MLAGSLFNKPLLSFSVFEKNNLTKNVVHSLHHLNLGCQFIKSFIQYQIIYYYIYNDVSEVRMIDIRLPGRSMADGLDRFFILKDVIVLTFFRFVRISHHSLLFNFISFLKLT